MEDKWSGLLRVKLVYGSANWANIAVLTVDHGQGVDTNTFGIRRQGGRQYILTLKTPESS